MSIKPHIRIGLVLFCTFFFQIAYAQYNFSLTIKLPSQFESDTINIDIDNAIENLSFKRVIKEGELIVKGIMQTKYSSVYLYFTKNEKWIDTSFYIGSLPAELICIRNDFSANPFLKCQFKNTYFQEITKMQFHYTSKEHHEYLESFKQYRSATTEDKDSLKRIFYKKKENYNLKTLNYLRRHKNSYYSFNYFNSYFVKGDHLSADSLLLTFNTFFPESFKNSREGKEIERNIIAKKNVVIGALAPGFESKGINSEIVKFEKKNSSRYTILQFWASWCVPCIKEIPILTEIREKYPEEKLRIISITLDTDSLKWITAVKKNKLLWENTNDPNIPKQYGITYIPAVLLISPNGTILYNNIEKNDNDLLNILLSLLQATL